MKKHGMISYLLAAALIASASGCGTAGATDDPVDILKTKGIIQGYEDGELHLERYLTRAEFTKMMVSAFCDAAKEDENIEFSDMEGHWSAPYVMKAVSAGMVDGFEDGTFRPEEHVTYEQAIKMLISMRAGYGLEYPEGYVMRAVDNGITDGVEAVIGEDITRGEAVSMMSNMLAYIEDAEQAEDEEDNFFYSITGNTAMKNASGGGRGGAVMSVPGSGAAAVNGYAVEAAVDDVYEAGAVLPEGEIYFNTEEYSANDENVFKNALTSPLSTFSIDTDTASYSNMRRYILSYGSLPPNGAVRSEELINYFDYDNPLPEDGVPFAVTTELGECPWNDGNKLLKISVQGAELTQKQPSNLVFLVDVSGSMYDMNKLPLVKKSLKLLLGELDETDTVSIVTYASGTRVVLESTPVSEKEKIIEALSGLVASGGTYGEAGINLAYEQAEKSYIDGNNRIILCTDGDFNIGNSSTGELDKLISEKRSKGIFLTVLGFGMGNYKDDRMETLADKGNGNYAYIDSAREAKKVFVDEMPKTLYTIAKDVKIQAEFNPALVGEYRLIGYENRVLNNEDFENDKKDAGELGSGASVTALYEIVPADGNGENTLKYQNRELTGSDELMTVKIRYKDPNGDESKLIENIVGADITAEPSADFCFAAAVAELGMILNDSEYKGNSTLGSVMELAKRGIGEDKFGFRTEFLHITDLIKYIEK